VSPKNHDGDDVPATADVVVRGQQAACRRNVGINVYATGLIA
jgi:hypothetical protein